MNAARGTLARISVLVLALGCGAPTGAAGELNVEASASVPPVGDETIARTSVASEAAPIPNALEATWSGDWIADGEVFEALHLTVVERDGVRTAELHQGLPAHASGAVICDAEALPGEAFDCEESVAEGARFRLERDAEGLTITFSGEGWSDWELPASARLRRIGRLEAFLWVEYSDLAHEAGETGEPMPEADPAATWATSERAIASAGLDPLALDEESAFALLDLLHDLEQRDAACREAGCSCPDVEQALAAQVVAFRSGLAWLGAQGVWSDPSQWDVYLRLDEGGMLRVYAFPDRLLCEGSVTAGSFDRSCGAAPITVTRGGNALFVTLAGAPRVAWQRASLIELLGAQQATQLEGTARDDVRSATRVANSLSPRPTTPAGARAVLEAAEAALDAERSCRAGRTPRCEVAALAALERARDQDAELRCALLQ